MNFILLDKNFYKNVYFMKKNLYLCRVINKNDMEMILSKYGFTKCKLENVWVKDNWEVYMDDKVVEIYEDFDKVAHPRYFVGNKDVIDLETILETIIDE